MRRAVCPGSYDPLTEGHMDVIVRAAAMFDELVVCVTENRGKNYLFTPQERAEQIRRCVAGMPNVSVDIAEGFIAQYARQHDCSVIVRGLRNAEDFNMEYTMSVYNRRLDPEAETIFLPAREEHLLLSSSAVRELAYFGAELEGYVPGEIIPDIIDRMKDKRRGQ